MRMFPLLALAACQLGAPAEDTRVEFDATVPASAIGWDGEVEANTPLAPPSFDLSADPVWIAGMPSNLYVGGLEPLTEFAIVGTLRGPGLTCAPPLGGECLEIASPIKVVTMARTDGGGNATVSLSIPLPVGTTVWLEAARPGDPGRVSTVVEITLTDGECGGYVDPVLGGCWYTGEVDQSCDVVCAPHGGYDAAGSTHSGNDIGMFFWPSKADGGTWVEVECSSIDNNTNWGANGGAPDPAWTHVACHANCSCLN
ncbi:MAG: hypothetical protein ACI8PZ_001384 [Myxococcota bacterium]|jgi:hypothetical protein